MNAAAAPVVDRDTLLRRLNDAMEALVEISRDVCALYAIPLPEDDASAAVVLICPVCREPFEEHEAKRKRGLGGVYIVAPCRHKIFVRKYSDD